MKYLLLTIYFKSYFSKSADCISCKNFEIEIQKFSFCIFFYFFAFAKDAKVQNVPLAFRNVHKIILTKATAQIVLAVHGWIVFRMFLKVVEFEIKYLLYIINIKYVLKLSLNIFTVFIEITYVVECNPRHIFMGWYQLFCLYTIFMMELNSFFAFPTCYDILDCFDGNKTISQTLMKNKGATN